MSGLIGAPSVLGRVRIERGDYVPCHVVDCRVVFEAPADIKVGPGIPEDVVWKLTPIDPS